MRTFIGDMHFLRTTRPIAKGEEITHQYLAPEYDISERQEKYKTTWNFECDCNLCVTDGAVSEEVRNKRRTQFEELKSKVEKLGESGNTSISSIKKIARGLRELEALYLPSKEEPQDKYDTLPRLALVHPTLFLTEAWRGVKNMDKTIEYAQKLLREFGILTTVEEGKFKVTQCSGLINVEGVRTLKYLTEAYSLKGEKELAEDCKRLAEMWYLIITGAEVGMKEFLALA